ncbi:MAG TPA: zinc-binding alcohol dehydrogenase family protein [Leadbetterella sp.]|nr:zinc-binding alcohol dehydrogenase family protein [Leadbetterella sp.]
MKAIVCSEPHKFESTILPYPEKKEGYSIVKVKRIGICGTDLHAFEGTQPYFSYPRILGHELACEIIESEGEFRVGDKVCILPYFSCGQCVACRNAKPNCCASLKVFGVHIDGGMSEYISVPTSSLVASQGLDFDALALVEPLAIGAHGVRRAKIKTSDKVLVIGAGPIGLGIIQFAQIAGAEVIVMDINNDRLNFCKEVLGAKHLINPTETDALEKIREITSGDMANVVIDATGNLRAINSGVSYLSHGGKFVLVGLQKGDISISHPEFHKREATMMSSRNATKADFEYVISCILNKKIKPETYITHRVGFDEMIGNFESYLDPETGVIKAMVTLD